MSPRIHTPEQLRDLLGETWTYSAEQWAAVTADPTRPAVIIAGAGSGKTAVMSGRVVWLVANGIVTPDQILGLTFTTKATGELQQRVRAALRRAGLLGASPDTGTGIADDVEEPTIATYHSYAANLLSEHGLRIGHEPDARLIADAARFQLAAQVVSRYEQPVHALTDHPDTVIGNLLALDGDLAEHLVSPEQLRAWDLDALDQLRATDAKGWKADYDKAISAITRRLELVGLVEAYRARKRHLGLIDFSDQIALTARLAEEHPAVGEAERERFRVVLLDEYQDTSVAQARMLRALFTGGHPVMAVGDPNQAIYGWRGASVSNILGFHRDFPPADDRLPTTLNLTFNRRSDRRILETANLLASPLYQATGTLPLRPKEDADPGEVRVAVFETYDDELDHLADQVRATHDRGTPWQEIGVLVRTNAHGADVYDRLTAAEIPVEIVGLSGLLRLPEIAEVLATLSLLRDVTDNAAVLTLLNGPRWAIGLRDQALLGRRARELGGRGQQRRPDVHGQLAAAVETVDPAEVNALCDALEDPGDLPYSAEARQRFAALTAELRRLRAAAGEPVLDLVRRIVETIGIDVELSSAVSESARARRDNLDLFLQAVAEFRGFDGQITLPALLAWLEAENDAGQGLDMTTPSDAESVKLLTIHRSKGLEWDVVFLPGVNVDQFPNGTLRSGHLTSPQVLPQPLRGDAHDLPRLTSYGKDEFKDWVERRRAHQADEELRLAYVAWTRARHELVVSSWRFGPNQPSRGFGPSDYLETTRAAMAGWGAEPERWAQRWERGSEETNPYAGRVVEHPWPISHRTLEVERRVEAARLVRDAVDDGYADELTQVWDTELARLLDELARQRAVEVEVPLPSALSATALARLREDPETFAHDLVRPMPRQPSAAARFGTRFHAWVETRFGQQDLFDPDELPGRGDSDIEDDADLAAVVESFERGEFADRAPSRVEAPFALVLAGQVVRGRIDAVYAETRPDGSPGWLLVDWKTSRSQTADPLQLALYRLAWAELTGDPPESVRAAFYYVRTDTLVEPADLPDRTELERIISVG
ncbi:UvrD-helicase domain-containing protein [Nocardioides sp.]|uniref:UvrD-helicase domain-containing protein n=1 Tax=Nocardioides sp. TaxID=35761 RepID=UPI0039E21BC8